MTRPFRLLGGSAVNSTASESQPTPATVDSNYVVILAALLCALICVLGLIAVARCACLRRLSGGGTANSNNNSAVNSRNSPANRGLKKKILRSLPKQIFTAESANKFSDCAICLTEFGIGDEIRVLPQCGHRFHVACIDTWLGSHSSCPSCRQILGVARCQKCGGFPASSSSSGGAETSESRSKEREDDPNRFWP